MRAVPKEQARVHGLDRRRIAQHDAGDALRQRVIHDHDRRGLRRRVDDRDPRARVPKLARTNDPHALIDAPHEVLELPAAELGRRGFELATRHAYFVVHNGEARRRYGRAIALPLRVGLAAARLDREDRRHDDARDQDDNRRDRAAHQRAVTTHKAACLVRDAGPMGRDGLARQEPADVRGHVRGGLIPLLGQTRHRLRNDGLDIAPQRSHHAAQALGRFFEHDLDRGVDGPVGRVERQRRAEQLERDHADGVNVAANIRDGGLALRLLGAQVRNRADDLARLRAERDRVGFLGKARHAEIEHLWLDAGRQHARVRSVGVRGRLHEDVVGLEIAMDDALLVRVMHRVAHPRDHLEAFALAQGVRLGKLQQRRPLDKLHGEIRPQKSPLGVGARAGFIDLRDAGMEQLAHRAGFLSKPPEQAAADHARMDDLERHAPRGIFLLGFIDDAHAAAPDLAHDLEAPDVRGRRFAFGRVVQREIRGEPLHAVRAAEDRRVLIVRRSRIDREQFFDLPPQLPIFAARAIEHRGALALIERERRREELLQLIERGVTQRPSPAGVA